MHWKRGLLALAAAAIAAVLVVAIAWSRPSTQQANLAGTPAGPARSPSASVGEAGASAGPADPGEPSTQDADPKPNPPAESFDPGEVAALKAALRQERRNQEREQSRPRSEGGPPSQESQETGLVEAPDLVPAPAPTLDFTLSSFNVLGSSHSARGGTRPEMAPGSTRIRWAAALLARHSVDVVGFQEFQLDQQRAFLRHTDGRYDVYPGFSKGGKGSNNSIAWRRDMWEVVAADTLPIPYFNGARWPMPVVLLRSKETGLSAFFSNFHNPASTKRHPNQSRWRQMAASMEVAMVNRLEARSDHPVFLVGDLNERQSAFCTMSGRAGMRAANGGSNTGACRPPGNIGIDWIFGTRDVTFYDYLADRSPLANRTTDHPMIVSGVRIGGR